MIQQIQPIKNKKKNTVLAAASVLLPAAALLVMYAACGIMPFGGKSILTGDASVQYSAFLVYLRELLTGGASWRYTFSKALGGDMAGFLSYYCLSPFNILLLLFKETQIQEAVLLLTLLKTGASGGSMYYYLKNKRYCGAAVLMFSTAYALMGYLTAYQNNIMWLDGMVFLPLLALGLERLLKAGRVFAKGNILYIAMLSLMLASNYYIGYMLCIFAVLYAAYYLFADDELRGPAPGARMRACRAFFGASLLSGGLAAVSLLPAAFSLRGGKAAFDIRDLLDFTLLYTPGQVVKELFIGNAAVKENFNTLPNIYCGLMVFIFAILYFAARKTSVREKAGSLMLLTAFLLSFLISAFDRVWHGTTVPAGSPHRYSFLFSFVLVLLAYKGYYAWHKGRLPKKSMLLAAGAFAAFLLWYLITRKEFDMPAALNILAGIIFWLCILYYGGKNGKKEREPYLLKGLPYQKAAGYIPYFLAAGLMAELIYSGTVSFLRNGYDDYGDFKAGLIRSGEYVEAVKALDEGWYRMEQSGTNVTMNDGMLFGYQGLWSYSSCEKESTKRLAGKFGLNDRTWWITYHNEMPAAAESLLGLRYIVTSQPVLPGRYETRKEFGEGAVIYENPYALSLGTLAGPEITRANTDTWDVLWLQNDLWKRITGGSGDIYRSAARDEILCEENRIVYSLPVREALPIFTCFRDFGSISELTVSLNGEEIRRLTPEMQTYCLGAFREGDELTISITSEGKDISWYDLYFYYEDRELLGSYAEQLKGRQLLLTEYKQDRFAGNIANQSDSARQLLLTVPAEKGWTVLVDGVKAQIVPAAGGFLSVEIMPGEHYVEASFVPQGLWQGMSITAACLLLCLAAACYPVFGEKRRGRD